MINLEPRAALAGAAMVGETLESAKAAENLVNKAVMVLAAQGLCAFGLFLATRKGEDAAVALMDGAVREMLSDAELVETDAPDDIPSYYRRLTFVREQETPGNALSRLILTAQIVEWALIYGRYHAKARAGAMG